MRIVLPSVEYQVTRHSLAARPPSLDGKVVAFTDTWNKSKADGSVEKYPLMLELEKLLRGRFRLSGCLWFHKTDRAMPLPPQVVEDIVQKADVVIIGGCWGGGPTSAVVKDSVGLEKQGKPTITIVHKSVEKLGLASCAAEGMPDLPFLFEPIPNEGNLTTEPRQIAVANIEHVISSLTSK